MESTEVAELFAGLLKRHVRAQFSAFPAHVPTPEQAAENQRRLSELAAMSDAALVALWECGDDTYCCDDIYWEGQRRGLGYEICI